MNVTEITIKGRVPSKKNSRDARVSKGRLFTVANEKYQAWHADATLQIKALPKIHTIHNPHDIQIDFYFPDNLRCDLTNKAESVMDLLVDNGILFDDRWQVTGPLYLRPAGIDKENPRVIIWIRYELVKP